MSDLIDRQAAIAALERKKDKTAKGEIGSFYNTIIQHDIDAIVDLPSAQPEPIRCKDCRHNYNCDIQYHAQAGNMFYCGAAERRTDA